MPSARTKPSSASSSGTGAAVPPVFHPDHPHNRPFFTATTPLGPAYDLNTPCPPVRTRRHPSASAGNTIGKSPGGMSDSDASASASPSRRRCFCGREVVDGGIYCSIDCARSDAFTSLCYKPGGPSVSSVAATTMFGQPSTESAGSIPLSRQPSSSAASTISTASEIEASAWNASHYRRVARSDARRDERREERRRRRAEGSVASSTVSRSTTYSTISTASSSASSRVPDLISGHSRNASTASSASSSGWSGAGLSRNPSSASTMSSASRRYRGDTVAVIQEDEDEEEFLDTRPYPMPGRNGLLNGGLGHSLGHKKTRSGHTKKRIAEPVGMGKDMRDILEEIISMEKSFNVDDDGYALGYQEDHGMQQSQPGLFTATFDKPPRTPSPIAPSRRRSVVPNAPARGHRSNLSNPLASPTTGAVKPHRPPSLIGLHQSSLSESHTALYLATASPVAPARRSASPQLRSRNSIIFTPESAGPMISGFASAATKSDSPIPSAVQLSTPSRRRPQISPNASYATMDGWRFPGSSSFAGGGGSTTPWTSQRSNPSSGPAQQQQRQQPERIPPHLLWPAPPMFPQSPGVDTPTFISALQGRSGTTGSSSSSKSASAEEPSAIPPSSGMRLGYLLGSGADTATATRTSHEGDIEMDLDDGDDDDEASTEQGHGGASHLLGHHAAYAGIEGQYLPVFLEAEGFRQTRIWGQA